MTRENAMQIGGLFPEVLKCETTSHTNAIGIKYMRLQVEVDTSSPVPTGFLHKGGKETSWVHFAYEQYQISVTHVKY